MYKRQIHDSVYIRWDACLRVDEKLECSVPGVFMGQVASQNFLVGYILDSLVSRQCVGILISFPVTNLSAESTINRLRQEHFGGESLVLQFHVKGTSSSEFEMRKIV